MPLEFLKRECREPRPRPRSPHSRSPGIALPDEVVAQEFQLKLSYAGKSSEGVRMQPAPRRWPSSRRCSTGSPRARSRWSSRCRSSSARRRPSSARPSEAMQWLNAHHVHSPVTRHALVVLESIDAIDLAFDTFVCAMLDGEVDTSRLSGLQRDRRRRRLALGRGDRRHDRAGGRRLGRQGRSGRHRPDRRPSSWRAS